MCSAVTRRGASLPTRQPAGVAARSGRVLSPNSLVQRSQNPGTRRSHCGETRISFGVAGIDLNGIPAVNDLPVLDEHDICALMPVVLEAHTCHPRPTFEGMYPPKSRYCECVVSCAIFEDTFEVI